MRIALISLTERATDDPDTPQTGLALAGRTVAERQLDLARALGCERIICMAHSADKDVAALRAASEQADLSFNSIMQPHDLLRLVSSADELLVMADGLICDPQTAREGLSRGCAVLAFPVEAGLAAGFERIDMNYAWAGILTMPGAMVERISQLPPDCDPTSALLRIALQGHVAERPLPEKLLEERNWLLVGSRREATEIEDEWLRSHLPAADKFRPGISTVNFALQRVGGRIMAHKYRPVVFRSAGWGLAVIGVAASWFGYAIAAILLCVAAWLVEQAASALERIRGGGPVGQPRPGGMLTISPLFVDLCLLLILGLALLGNWPDRLFGPFMLLSLMWLASMMLTNDWAELARDRLILGLVLSVAAGFGALLSAIQLISVAIALLLLMSLRRRSPLTQA